MTMTQRDKPQYYVLPKVKGLRRLRILIDPVKAQAAELLGQRAFERGMMCVPAFDKDLMPLLGGDQSLPVLDAWVRGWHKANLAAPVEMVDCNVR